MPYQLEANSVVEGTFYRHYKSRDIYEIVTLALNEGDETTQVVYKNWDGHVFVRPLVEFVHFITPGTLTPPITPVQRFELITDREALRDLQAHEKKRNINRIA